MAGVPEGSADRGGQVAQWPMWGGRAGLVVEHRAAAAAASSAIQDPAARLSPRHTDTHHRYTLSIILLPSNFINLHR